MAAESILALSLHFNKNLGGKTHFWLKNKSGKTIGELILVTKHVAIQSTKMGSQGRIKNPLQEQLPTRVVCEAPLPEMMRGGNRPKLLRREVK